MMHSDILHVRNGVVVIKGPVGMGKTLTALYLSLYHQARHGLHIYSTAELYAVAECSCGGRHSIVEDSYWCDKKGRSYSRHESEFVREVEYTHLSNFWDLQVLCDKLKEAEEPPSSITKGSFLMDDGHKFLDSRMSQSKVNRLVIGIIQDYSRSQLDFYITAHHLDMLDKRLRRHISYFVTPTFYEGEDLCVAEIQEVASGKATQLRFQPSLVYPFYKTEERIVQSRYL